MLRVLLPNTQPETQDVSRLALPNTASPAYSLIAELADQIRRFLQGEGVDSPAELLALDRCPDLERRVLLAENSIPRAG